MKPIINSTHFKCFKLVKVKLLSEVIRDANLAFIQETRSVYLFGVLVSSKVVARPFSLKDALETYVEGENA
jgi:hypothetical protein